MKTCTSIKEIKSIICNLPENKPQGLGISLENSITSLQGKRKMNLSQKVAAEERVPNSFYEISNCLIPKQDNDITRKKSACQYASQNQLKNLQQNQPVEFNMNKKNYTP